MEDEYEYIVSDSAENCKTLTDWFFSTSGEIIYYLHDLRWSVAPGIFLNRDYRRKKPQTDVLLTDPEDIARGVKYAVLQIRLGDLPWQCVHSMMVPENIQKNPKSFLDSGYIFRLKPDCKLPPKKTKKLVPRTPEEFWPLIGRWWCRHKKDN